jgi:hypothetical protein
MNRLTSFGFLALPIVLISLIFLSGCTPQFNWREVRNEQPYWVATFPDKPVEVTRTITLPGMELPVALTIRSARINDSMFAVGWAVNTGAGGVSGTTSSSSSSEKLRQALETAMLSNLQHNPATLKRSVIEINGRTAHQVIASGSIQTSAKGPAEKAGLWMQSLVIGGSPSVVIEIIAVGPASFLDEEKALQFLQSFRLQPL